jgi:hypothetical protein
VTDSCYCFPPLQPKNPKPCTCGLDALLRLSETPQREESKDDHGAELTGQTIPKSVETEPRPNSYIGHGPLGCLAKAPGRPEGFGCTRDRGHDGEHVAVGGPHTDDEYGYLHWPQVVYHGNQVANATASGSAQSEAQKSNSQTSDPEVRTEPETSQ